MYQCYTSIVDVVLTSVLIVPSNVVMLKNATYLLIDVFVVHTIVNNVVLCHTLKMSTSHVMP